MNNIYYADFILVHSFSKRLLCTSIAAYSKTGLVLLSLVALLSVHPIAHGAHLLGECIQKIYILRYLICSPVQLLDVRNAIK